eukprot:gb/GECG01004799.1/.p1 GENE.gb/GECG01004799.1/~~gb/GECG01004799.1/.p1  ORF type:complete len:463 (+),score=35.85 gb/GECG01004799.1/:1-1389(+)
MWTVGKTSDPERGGRLAEQIASAVRHLIFAWEGRPTLVRVLYLDAADFDLERVDTDDVSGWKDAMLHQIESLLSRWGFERSGQCTWKPPTRVDDRRKATLVALTWASTTFEAILQAVRQTLSHVHLSCTEPKTATLFSNNKDQVRALLHRAGLECPDRQIDGIVQLAAMPHRGQNVEQVIASTVIPAVCQDVHRRIRHDGVSLVDALAANGKVKEVVRRKLFALLRDGGQWIAHAPETYWLRLILLQRLQDRQLGGWTDSVPTKWGDVNFEDKKGRQVSCQARWCRYSQVEYTGADDSNLLAVLKDKEAEIGAEDHVFVYHGTTVEHVPSIIHRVQRLNNECWDFGLGFYTNQNPEHCAEWATRVAYARDSNAAVIGFAMPQHRWQELKKLNFEEDVHKEHWKTTVEDCRDGEPPEYLMKYDVVIGPMLGNANQNMEQVVFRVVRVLNDSSQKFFVLLPRED